MWAHVRFLCDQKTANVPRSFIQDEGELGLNQECHVFWSPDPQETPKDVLSKQGKILNIDTLIETKNKKKTKQPINGYYRAIILKLADTEEELDNMGQERIRYPARKRSPSPSGLIGKNIQKMKKMQHQEAFQFNLNETLSIGNDSTKEQLQVKIKKLEAKYNRLKVEVQDLRALNINLQKQMFRLSALPSPATLPIPSNSSHLHNAAVPLPQVSAQHSLPNWTPPPKPAPAQTATSEETTPPLPITATESTPPAVAEPSLSFLETFLPSSQPEGIIEKFQIDPSKLEMAKKVKAGEPGDSLYIKNLAVVVWGKQELANRSVCGFRCNAKKVLPGKH
ncbi:hypothetical protein JTE90_003373 [Oedothorax gibbosus]|uniref:BEN domain-containing protein n=1 Tax=Oedothorax gibbosus TaxID=931172 RepID=A0AAV6TX98_9ARAC|nr:hypothetical protein JTE90_003373 [Oedothorax gibbosus]